MKSGKLLALFCFANTMLFAQKSFEPGFILLDGKDTVRGLIEITSEAELCAAVNFKKDSESIKTYTPSEIKGFGVGHEVYRSLRFVNTAEDSIKTEAFLKQLVIGVYSLYSYVKPDRRFYLIQNDTTQFFMYDQVSESSGRITQKDNYYNYLHFISINCDNLANLWDRVSFNDQQMAGFVIKVDHCLSPGQATNYYEKPKTVMKALVFVGAFPVPNMSQFTANFVLRFTIPRVDKKTSVNIGLNYVNNVQQTTERSDYYSLYTLTTHNQIYSLPVTIQYNFTNTIVQPYFYAGASAAYLSKTTNSYTYDIPRSDTIFGVSFVGGLGIEVKVASGLFIRADWRYEVFLQYPVLGVAYSF